MRLRQGSQTISTFKWKFQKHFGYRRRASWAHFSKDSLKICGKFFHPEIKQSRGRRQAILALVSFVLKWSPWKKPLTQLKAFNEFARRKTSIIITKNWFWCPLEDHVYASPTIWNHFAWWIKRRNGKNMIYMPIITDIKKYWCM